MYRMAKEMIAKMVMEYNVMIPGDSRRDTKPMSGVLEAMLMSKYVQKTNNLTGEVVFASMSPMLMNVTLTMESAAQ